MARHQNEYSDSLVDYAVAEGKISRDDANLMKEYLAEQRKGESSPATLYNTFYDLMVFRQYIGEYRHNSPQDLLEGILKFKKSGRKQTTVMQYLTALKRFYLWLVDNGYSTIAREILEHKIKVRKSDRMAVMPEPILTGDEITHLIRACNSSRDRAFVALLYDAGLKTKEACMLTWSQCRFDENGLYLTVGEQTNGPFHAARCVMAADYLRAWRNDYPGDTDGENPVFITRPGNPFSYQWAYRLLGKIVKESGIKKPVHLHSLRHSRTKHPGAEGSKEKAIKKMLWGPVNSGKVSVHEHHVDSDTD